MIRRLRLSRARLLALALPLAACAPVVTHGPRVEDGPSVFGTAGATATPCGDECAGGLTPSWGVGFRYGFVPADSSMAVLVGALVPVIDVSSAELDVYAQAGDAGEWAFGAGALASRRHLMPYVQVGKMDAGGSGPYATLGYAWLSADPTPLVFDNPDSFAGYPRYWAPGLGYRRVLGDRRLYVLVNGAFGSYVEREITMEGETRDVRRPVRSLSAAVSVEIPLRGGARRAFGG